MSFFFRVFISTKSAFKTAPQNAREFITLYTQEFYSVLLKIHFLEKHMENFSKEEKHAQCVREIKATLIATAVCCIWHIGTAFLLNGKGLYFLGMPAWFSVSVFGTIVLSIGSVIFLVKKVFKDFEYDTEAEEKGEEK